MARDLTVFTPDLELEPFTDLGGLAFHQRSALPRQQLTYTVVNGEITVPTAGDNQGITLSCALPANYAYALVGIHMSIYTASGANNWEQVAPAYTRVTTDQGARKYNKFMELYSHGSISFGSTAKQKIWTPQQLDRELILGNDARLIVEAQNLTVDDVAATADIVCRFLQYDVSQALSVLVNTPQVIR